MEDCSRIGIEAAIVAVEELAGRMNRLAWWLGLLAWAYLLIMLVMAVTEMIGPIWISVLLVCAIFLLPLGLRVMEESYKRGLSRRLRASNLLLGLASGDDMGLQELANRRKLLLITNIDASKFKGCMLLVAENLETILMFHEWRQRGLGPDDREVRSLQNRRVFLWISLYLAFSLCSYGLSVPGFGVPPPLVQLLQIFQTPVYLGLMSRYFAFQMLFGPQVLAKYLREELLE